MRTALALAFCAALSIPVGATQVDVSAYNTSGFSYAKDPSASTNPAFNAQLKTAVANGTELLTGTTVLIGSFGGLSDAQIASDFGNTAHLKSIFTEFGSAAFIGDGTDVGNGPVNGAIQASYTGNLNATPSLKGQQIYILVIAATDNTTVNQAFATAFQIGIFYLSASQSGNTDWLFPTVESVVNPSQSIEISDLTQPNGQSLVGSAAHLVVGTFGLAGSDRSNFDTNSPAAYNFTLAMIPEPSVATFLMSGVAAIGALRRRRLA